MGVFGRRRPVEAENEPGRGTKLIPTLASEGRPEGDPRS